MRRRAQRGRKPRGTGGSMPPAQERLRRGRDAASEARRGDSRPPVGG